MNPSHMYTLQNTKKKPRSLVVITHRSKLAGLHFYFLMQGHKWPQLDHQPKATFNLTKTSLSITSKTSLSITSKTSLSITSLFCSKIFIVT